VLTAVLVAAAAAIAYAGIRVPLPARLPRPGRAAKVIVVAAWVAAVAALLACVTVYIVQVSRAGLARVPRSDSITPVTLAGVVVLFVVMSWRRRHGAGGWLRAAR
jgi:F0F1-type ATP synthase membrane subunit a